MYSEEKKKLDDNLSMHELAANNDVQNLTSKLSSLRLRTEERNEFNLTPLHVAAINNEAQSHFEVIEVLLNNGADPNARDSYNCTPVWYVVQNGGNVDFLKLFSRFKADFNCFDEEKKSLLTQAIESCNLDALKFIGLDVNHKDENGMTPLHYAAEFNENDSHYEVLEFLLEMGSDVNALDSKGESPFEKLICSPSDFKVLELFSSYNVDLSKFNEVNIFDAFVLKNVDVQVLDRLLINYGDSVLDINQIVNDDEESTYMHEIFYNYFPYSCLEPFNVKVIKCLLKNGANINIPNVYGDTPATIAMQVITEDFKEEDKKFVNFVDLLLAQTDFTVVRNNEHVLSHYPHRHPKSPIWKLILKHLAKLKFLRISIHPIVQKFIEDRTYLKDYFDECTKELEIMKNTKPQKSWITFFNLLVDGRRKLKNYAGNEDLITDFKNNDWSEMFPIYRDFLKRNLDKGLRRRELFDKSSILLSECLPIFSSIHLIVKDILDCVLSKKDLTKFLCE